jgi:chromate transport protein ChrA
MQLVKLYLWIIKISFLSFGGAYSIWALLLADAGHDCTAKHQTERLSSPHPHPHPHALSDSLPARPVSACRTDLQRLMGLSELLPGPQVNGIAMTAYAAHGIPGMLVLLLGLMTPGLVLIPLLLRLLRRHAVLPLVQAFFTGAGIATTAILGHFALTLLTPLIAQDAANEGISRSLLLAGLTLVALVLSLRFRLNPGLIVIGGGIFGYFFL